MALAVGCSVAISLCTELGCLRIKDTHWLAMAPHLAWITAGACLLVCALALRGWSRALLVSILLTVSGGSLLGFVALPEFGLPLIPVPQEIARARHHGGDLVGYRIYSLYRPIEVAICQEVRIFQGVYWNDLLARISDTDQVDFEAGKDRVWTCYFPPHHPGQPHRSRTVILPH